VLETHEELFCGVANIFRFEPDLSKGDGSDGIHAQLQPLLSHLIADPRAITTARSIRKSFDHHHMYFFLICLPAPPHASFYQYISV
jgi:hypothetical protein